MDIVEAVKRAREKHNVTFQLKEKQMECLENVVGGKDVLAVLPTGYGKTAIYALLPEVLMQMKGNKVTVVVLSPLKALMKDQVRRLRDMKLSAICVTDEANTKEDEELLLCKCAYQVILFSPEALTMEKWRSVLQLYKETVCTIVVDEAHCIEQWGDDFRQDFCRIAEVRAFLPDATMLAMTATAPPSTIRKIQDTLQMINPVLITTDLNRSNIFYECYKASVHSECFIWLITQLKELSIQTPKTIIYCRNIKSCALLYEQFMEHLGDTAYVGPPGFRTRIVAMFHHSTLQKIKDHVVSTFTSTDSIIRVVFATIAFGMGVDAPDISQVIHYGAPRSMMSFAQESGRAGRDPEMEARSIVYYHMKDTTVLATDTATQEYCRNPTNKCLRQMIASHFTAKAKIAESDPRHKCCSVCASSCCCGDCDFALNTRKPLDVSDMLANAAGREMTRHVDVQQRELIEAALLDYRRTFGQSLLTGPGIFTGLTNQVLHEVAANLDYILSASDLQSSYGLDSSIASNVWDIICQITGQYDFDDHNF